MASLTQKPLSPGDHQMRMKRNQRLKDKKAWFAEQIPSRRQRGLRIGEAALSLTSGTAVRVGQRSRASGHSCQVGQKGLCGLSPPRPSTTFLTMRFIAEVGGAS